jgi:hypothetical protein
VTSRLALELAAGARDIAAAAPARRHANRCRVVTLSGLPPNPPALLLAKMDVIGNSALQAGKFGLVNLSHLGNRSIDLCANA